MSLRNTPDNYGSIAKWFHWGTALLVLGSYLTVYYRDWFTEKQTPENWTVLQLHLAIGVSIGALVVLRILWRSINPTPRLEPGSTLQQGAAKLGHLALYAVLIVMPISGYLGTGADINFFGLFDIPSFQNTLAFQQWIEPHMSFKAFEEPFDFVHKELLGGLLLWMLILGHAAAALYHHFVQHDRTLRKMTSGR